MIRNFLKTLANVHKGSSLATRLRSRRINLFKKFISSVPTPRRILDVGGEEIFWERTQFAGDNGSKITLLNLSKVETHYGNFESIVCYARNMSQLGDKEYDIVLSNSVIEHLGSYEDQKKMAKGVQRVGKRYFVQTPNFYFPFEPHFLFPFFQFFPLWLKVLMIRNFSLGWISKTPRKEEATKIARSIRLLKKKELRELFPEATIYEERILFFPYSFIVCEGSRV